MRAATAPKPATIRVAYSPAEAAEALGLSRATVHNLIRAGEIASTKIGRSRRIPAAELQRIALEGADRCRG